MPGAAKSVAGIFFASRGRFGDGCAWLPSRWQSTLKADGKPQLADGYDQVNALFEGGRWRLCDSDFDGHVTVNGKPSAIKFKK